MLPNERLGHHHKAGRAIAALEGSAFDECLLHWVKLARGSQMLNRDHLGAVEKNCEMQTARHRPPVHQHGAAAAQALPATFSRAEQAQIAFAALRPRCGADFTSAETGRPLSVKLIVTAAGLMSFIPERLVVFGTQRAEHRLRGQRQFGEAHAHGIVDGIGDRRR